MGSIRVFLERFGADVIHVGEALRHRAIARPELAPGAVAQVQLGPPVADPAKVLRIGLNYRDQVMETGKAMPTAPEMFPKFASTLIGPYDPIACSDVSDHLNVEGELAIVIGQRCRNVSGGDALAAIAGLWSSTTSRPATSSIVEHNSFPARR